MKTVLLPSALLMCGLAAVFLGCTSAALGKQTLDQAAVEAPTFVERGVASWYGGRHAGHKTASGEYFDMEALTAAHRTLPFGTIVRVTDLRSGRMVKVRINDRGPNSRTTHAILDLSKSAARVLDIERRGVSRVKIEAFASDQSPIVLARAHLAFLATH